MFVIAFSAIFEAEERQLSLLVSGLKFKNEGGRLFFIF